MLVNRPIVFWGPFSKHNVQLLIELSLISISCYELFPMYDLKKNIIPGLNLMVIFKESIHFVTFTSPFTAEILFFSSPENLIHSKGQ